MRPLDKKMNELFAGLVVRKDLVKSVKGNAIVPTYVLEYLLGQYCATSDPDSVESGIETVKQILQQHFVHRNEAGLIRSTIREKRRHKVIDKISVSLNDKNDCYEATFSNLGIKKVLVGTEIIKKHPKLLVSGVWCIADVEYEYSEDKSRVPWILVSLKPIQLSSFDFNEYVETRKKFTTDEWIDLLIQSIGFDPEKFGRRSKLMQLVRLIPYCERNFNLIELGPKGTGKSHIYSEFSPHGILISGGEVTVPKLFVNNSTGKIGLVGYWDCVAFDEFAGKKKRSDKALVDILKNYMANKSFSRGIEMLSAEASMAFVGNTRHTLPYMLKHADLFDELPEQYHDSAFLDRLHFYVPGWEVDIIRSEMFSDGFGFVVDYLAEILRNLRNYDYANVYQDHFQLSTDISTRDRDGINKTFSGLMKILHPNGEAPVEEIEELLRFAMEGRKRVKDQLMRIDSTYPAVRFEYQPNDGEFKLVKTLEEAQYPQFFGVYVEDEAVLDKEEKKEPEQEKKDPEALEEKHLSFQENQRGVSYDSLIVPYLKGASRIIVTDPYIRMFYQVRNFMELMEALARMKGQTEEVEVELITAEDEYKPLQHLESLNKIQESCGIAGIHFTWTFVDEKAIHARHIVTDTGWKILLDRGLDIFQHYEMNDAFAIENRLQQFRACKAFEITFLRMEKE